MACHGWLEATRHLPKPLSSKFADEGVAAHDILDSAITFDLTAEDLCDDDNMAQAVGQAIDWLKQYLVLNPGTEYQCEASIPWGRVIGYPKLTGTSDIILSNPEELVITDYKHGAGILVEPDSPQLMCYMIGLRQIVGRREQYRNVIIQPRARHVSGPVREWVYDNTALDNFAEEVRDAIKANFQAGSPRTAGDHCRWCAAAPTCRALATKALSVAVDEFSAIEKSGIFDG